jgi:hypothetical protein
VATPTYNEQMVAKLQALLLTNAGAASISLDGHSVSFADLERRLQMFEKRVDLEQGRVKRFQSIRLDCMGRGGD